MVALRRGAKKPRHVVSLSNLDELRNILVEDGAIRIGALATVADLRASEAVASARPELLDAGKVFGTPQVRHRATLGGNLCTAASCSDLAPILLALGARVAVCGPEGTREIQVEDFFGDHRKTVLRDGYLLSAIVLPVRTPGEGGAYEAFGLRATNFITVAGAAASLRMDGGRCTRVRLALGAVAPTPILVDAVEERLVGGALDNDDLSAAADLAAAAARPISDIRGSAEHRRELVRELSIRALRTARERAS
jgi:carbon-monoxide dehydrogenase medium subunit